jgi:mRNA-degrading endonuclease RelE of RelBE toxin-antitoxin system
MCAIDLSSIAKPEPMIFIETPVFTSDVSALLSDDSYTELQLTLAARPAAGDLIPGTGGLRKIRWALPGRGKRGGARVIYYWRMSHSQILMLAIYGKGAKDDLSAAEKRLLQRIVERWS